MQSKLGSSADFAEKVFVNKIILTKTKNEAKEWQVNHYVVDVSIL